MNEKEHSTALKQTQDSTEQSNLERKFAIERDYIDKTFNDIGLDSTYEESQEAIDTKLAYDERNIYVMEYLQKIKEKETEMADLTESSPEPQSQKLHN